MKLKNTIKRFRNTIIKSPIKRNNKTFYLIIWLPILFNSLATAWWVKYYWERKNINHSVREYTAEARESLLPDLNNDRVLQDFERESTQSSSSEGEIISGSKDLKIGFYDWLLNKHFPKTSQVFWPQIAIVNQDGLIVAHNFRNLEISSTSVSQNILIYFQERLDILSGLDGSQILKFQAEGQTFRGQIVPWQNKSLNSTNSTWFVVLIVPESELAINSSNTRNNSIWQYAAYLLAIAVIGLLTYCWLIALIAYSSSAVENEATSSPKLLPQASLEPQIEDSNNQKEQVVEKNEPASNYEPYVLLADMSHELRSPLNAILGFVQIMEQEISIPQSSQKNIAIIRRSGDRLLSIINDVIDLAKIETNRLTLEKNNVDFYSWLDNVEHSIKFQAQSQGWEFLVVKSPNLPQYVCIDEQRLRQILKNLIDYCLQPISPIFTAEANKVSIQIDCCESSQDTNNANSLESSTKQNICFEVENANFPVTETELATLFDPAMRVKTEQRPIEGSSLNLPISRRLAQLMDGDITVGNSGNTITGITFKLKIKTETVAAEDLPVQSTFKRVVGLKSDRSEYRILVVDDSKTNRKIMLQLLEPVGFKVKEAVNGQEAVDIWLHWQPHMIWMDLKMPVMNGYEATEQIKSYSKPPNYTPIVALSASSLEEERSLFEAAGCDDFVGKPFTESIIFDKIAQHLGIRYVYESIASPESSNFTLTADALNVMPEWWLEEVEASATVLDRDSLLQLLQEIPSEHIELKNALQKQVDNFDFDVILNLAAKSKNRSN